MTLRRLMILGALASGTMLAAGSDSRADYTYSTTVSFTPVSGLGLTVTGLSGGPVSDSTPSTPSVLSFAYSPTSSGSGSEALSFTTTLTGTPGTEVVTISGTYFYTFTPSFVSAGFNPASETIVSGSGYSVPFFSANYTTLSTTSGSLQVSIIPVPEPASVAMLGLGSVGVVGYGLRRRRAKG